MSSSERSAPHRVRSAVRLRRRRPAPVTTRPRRDDRGSVTAETAVALPALVAFAMGLVWALTAVAAQIQCVDAARAGARAAARSEPVPVAVAAARSLGPQGARVAVSRRGDLWHVRVEADAPGPGGLGLSLEAEAAALAEDTVRGGDFAGASRARGELGTDRHGVRAYPSRTSPGAVPEGAVRSVPGAGPGAVPR